MLKASPSKVSKTLCKKKKKPQNSGFGVIVQVLDCLPSMLEALVSIHSTENNEKITICLI
jgi:hypothetical protein